MAELFTQLGETKVLALLTGSESKSVALSSANMNGGYDIRVFNDGAVTVYVEYGAGSATAVVPGVASADATGGLPVATKTTLYMRVPAKVTHVAAIATASAAKNLYVTPGILQT